MKEIWFKQKSYGWGWTPANWKGWLSTFQYILSMCLYPIYVDLNKKPFDEVIFWIISTALTGVFIGICFFRGETPKWNWGKKDHK